MTSNFKGTRIPLSFLLIGIFLWGAGGNPGRAMAAEVDQTLVIAQGGEATIFDIAKISDIPTQFIAKNMLDYLVTTDFDGNFLPQLAKSWKSSEDLKTWTFQLREKVKFHDGTPFNSAAAKFNFERYMNKEISIRSALFSVIAQIETPNEYTIIFKLNKPMVSFIDELINGYTGAIQSPTAMQKLGKDYGLSPVGTGPFKFKQWIRNERIILERNSEYWAGAPKLKQIVYRPIPDPQTAILELETGGVHIATVVPPEEVPRLKRNKDIGMMEDPSHTIRAIGFQTKGTPFADVRVRRAVSYGVNVHHIVTSLAGDSVVKTQGPMPKISWAFDPSTKELDYNPELAKRLLADAGWKTDADGILKKDGVRFEVNLITPVGRYIKDKEICEAIQADLIKLGIRMKIETLEGGTWWTKVRSAKGFDMTFLGIGPRPPEPATSPLSISFTTTGYLNHINYGNPEVDRLMAEAATLLDKEKRKALYFQAQKLVIQDAPALWLYSDKSMVAVRKEVKGYRHSAVRLSWLYNDVMIGK